MNKVSLERFESDTALAHAVATAWLDQLEAANREGQNFCMALSGGRIARRLFGAFTELATHRGTTLDRGQFFWADERCVPPDDPESNHKLAREALFNALKIQGSQIHRILGEESPGFAAQEAEAEICRIAPLNGDGLPVLDLVLLGLGEDGHIASLFPKFIEQDLAVRHAFQWVRNSPKPPPDRISLSYAAIAAARNVWVVVSGHAKAQALADSMKSDGPTPLAKLIKLRKATRVFSDITQD